MRKLDRIHLINAAGFDEIEFPVGGHGQVIGVNGHGKSTLLRTILFFYLGTNEKAPYALHETKADFVSHYLGDPPSYLIYEVARGGGEPSYHIAVTRPAGRIQFHFIDAPYRRDYYVEGRLVREIEAVHDQLREAKCAFDLVHSYEEFSRRIYGITASTYSVFRPAQRSSGQVGVLPRIISGIFTVSQLDADKLKSALTCGVRQDSLTTELDLVLLKNQLENFRRVNRAVKTYLKHEQEAVELVILSEEFENIKVERHRAIEELVSAAKLLPEKSREIEEKKAAIEKEQVANDTEYNAEHNRLNDIIEKLGNALAILNNKITEGQCVLTEYETREIDRKTKELERLSPLSRELTAAQQEYASLTAKYDDENQRKEGLLANLRQNWAELRNKLEQRKSTSERETRETLEKLDEEKTKALSVIEQERLEIRAALIPRRTRLETDRSALTDNFKALSKLGPPKEPEIAGQSLEQMRRKQNEESTRRERLKSDIALANEKAKRENDDLQRKAEAEGTALQTNIDRYDADRERVAKELDAFDESLARFFQTDSPETWPSAAKTFNRETLFRSAAELEATPSPTKETSAWGVKFAADKLPEPKESYDRDKLAARLQELRKNLAHEKNLLQAARERFLTEADSLQKQTAQTRKTLEAQLSSSGELRRSLLDDVTRGENKALTLQSQFDASKAERTSDLEKQAAELQNAENLLRQDDDDMEQRFSSRKFTAEESFNTRRQFINTEAAKRLSKIAQEEMAARQKHENEVARVEEMFRQTLMARGVDTSLIEAAQKRATDAQKEIDNITEFQTEVREYTQKKCDFIDPLPSLRVERQTTIDSSEVQKGLRRGLCDRRAQAMISFKEQLRKVNETSGDLDKDNEAAKRFRGDTRFLLEWGLFDRDDLTPAPYYRSGAVRECLSSAEGFHERVEQVGKDGNRDARKFLTRFDSETLDRKVLGFSPIHEHFDWFIFVGAELKPFVDNRGIQGMRQIQTREFEELIRKVCAKNADFREGVRQVKQTADLVQSHLRENNFVDVLDSIELKVDRVDNNLTQILAGLEEFEDVNFGSDGDLFGKSADRAQIDRAIGTFERLLREIDSYRGKNLSLTDYFDFLIRVSENGNDMGWRRSLDHIGSTGTDYLVKMLIYLSLIEVYRERAIDSTKGSTTVHCVLDETGVLAPKYVRSVLEYAAKKGIILITAGHSQQTAGFEYWIRVRKFGQRFGGQTVLRKVLQCD